MTSMNETPLNTIPIIFDELRLSFNAGKTKPLAWRKQQIEQIYKMCDEQKSLFALATKADFHRPDTETIVFDCGSVSDMSSSSWFDIVDYSSRFVMNVHMFSIILMNGLAMKNVRMLLHFLHLTNIFILNRWA
jgi:hypothetical protein